MLQFKCLSGRQLQLNNLVRTELHTLLGHKIYRKSFHGLKFDPQQQPLLTPNAPLKPQIHPIHWTSGQKSHVHVLRNTNSKLTSFLTPKHVSVFTSPSTSFYTDFKSTPSYHIPNRSISLFSLFFNTPVVPESNLPSSSTSPTTSSVTFPPSSLDPFVTPSKPLTASTPPSSIPVEEVTQDTLTPVLDTGTTLASYGLGSSYTPVGWIQQTLEALHVHGGLPWWGSIMVVTLTLRLCLLPLMLKLQHHTAMLTQLKPEVTRLNSEIKEAKKYNNNAKVYQKSKELRELFQKNEINPLKTLLMPLIQTPILISFFFAIRQLSESQVPSFINEAFLWVPHLGLADPYHILPVTAAGLILTTFELGTETGGAAAQSQGMKLFGRVFALCMIPFTMNFPSALHVYWCTSSFFSLLQLRFFKSPSFRAWVKLPPLPPSALVPLNHQPLIRPLGFINSFRTVHALKQK
ncbi:Mitochondrial inner membrane protein oxa1l [Coelomomyces lativittatus]|nr:Mitochondrial inner membrane protein oxa1l [Coelomomyces lativittatus]KAJ1500960.1 Mitochondrial inner membrane protein oxa1l [Coelomomyces lativittatus]KAJ1512532.1 Mitochondrial inner membrane protein oxa1l [Coelomomyces lativittatus]